MNVKNMIPKTEFAKNVFTITTGTVISQAILLMAWPILASIYSPADFGIFALYISMVNIISSFVTGKYEMAIILPEKEDDASNLLASSIITTLAVSLIAFSIIFISNQYIIKIFNNVDILSWIYLVPITAMFAGVYQSLYFWFNRKKHYVALSASKIWQSVVNLSLSFIFGFAGLGFQGLILGYLSGQISAIYPIMKGLRQEIKMNIRRDRILYLSKKYINYPIKSSLSSFFNIVSYQAEYMLFPIFFGLIGAGYYYFASRIITTSYKFIASAVWQVFLGESGGKHNDEVVNIMQTYQQKMFKWTTLPFYSSLFLISYVFITLFGPKWSGSIPYFYPLIIAAHINLIVSSFSIFVLINKPGAELIFNLFFVSAKTAALVLSYYLFKDLLICVMAISIVQAIMFLCLGSWNYRQLGKSYYYFISLYLKSLAGTFPYLAVMLAASVLSESAVLLFIVFIAINGYNYVNIGVIKGKLSHSI